MKFPVLCLWPEARCKTEGNRLGFRVMDHSLRFFLVGLASCVGALGFAEVPETKPGPETKLGPEFEKIRDAPMFAIGGVGIAARLTEAEVALENLLKKPSAADHCRKLVKEGTMAGQLYGLLGLKRSDPAGFKKLVRPYRDSKEMVQTASGCIMGSIEVSTVAAEIENGEFEFPAR